MKLGEKIVFGFAAVVVIAAGARGYQVITAEQPSMPKHYYEWDQTGLDGHYLYRELGCKNCHRSMGTGEVGVAPVLDGVGTRRTPEWLQQYLADPGSLVEGTAHDGSFAPDFRSYDNAQRELLAAYLVGLRANPNSPNYPRQKPPENQPNQ